MLRELLGDQGAGGVIRAQQRSDAQDGDPGGAAQSIFEVRFQVQHQR